MKVLRDRLGAARDAIVNDISRSIAEGFLKADDKLASTRMIGRSYKVSQSLVFDAMRELERRSLVEIRPRSGCYVKSAIRAPETRLSISPSRTVPPTPRRDFNPDFFLSPKSKVKEISFYVAEGYDSSLSCFGRVLEEFNSRNTDICVKMLSYMDGHLQDLLDEGRELDIVQNSLAVLKEIGRGSFLALGDVGRLGIDEDSMPAALRRHLHSWGADMRFAPFSLALKYLYYNSDMLSRSKSLRLPESPEEILSIASEFERRFAADDEYGLFCINLMFFIRLFGAEQTPKGGKINLDLEKTGRLLNMMDGVGLKCMAGETGLHEKISRRIRECFFAGRLLFNPTDSYWTQALQDAGAKGWKVAVLPSASDARFESNLTALAILKKARYPRECLRLIEHLSSRDIQKEFMDLHGNLPIYSDLYDSREKLKGHPVTYDVIHETLEKSVRNWIPVHFDAWTIGAVNDCGARFFSRQASAEETLRKLVEFSR